MTSQNQFINNFPINLLILCLALFSCKSGQNAYKQGQVLSYEKLSVDSLLNLVQYKTFQYFWDGAEPVSGMARERYHVDGIYPQDDKNVVTTGGSGFGIMAILVGIERNFITREEGLDRLKRIVKFLKSADRFHGAWPHWLYGETGRVKPFSKIDNGADIVETAFLIQGLLTARQFFSGDEEKEIWLRNEITKLWHEVNWNWFTRGSENVIYWHWSPEYGWDMNHPVRGWDECLIVYVLAASSPAFPVSEQVYHFGWAREGNISSGNKPFGINIVLKHNRAEEFGGPLFWSHYSFLGLDPRHLQDRYAHYWKVNTNHTLINRQWCIENPNNFNGYGSHCWGLTASYSPGGYAAHAPGHNTDLGVISPTASLSALPYTPEYSIEAMEHFYYNLGEKIFGKYGFYDAFSIHYNWFPKRYLAIDQGPIVVMIENYRSGMLWEYFMKNQEIIHGLEKLGFRVNQP